MARPRVVEVTEARLRSVDLVASGNLVPALKPCLFIMRLPLGRSKPWSSVCRSSLLEAALAGI